MRVKKASVVVNFQIEGLHHWPEAREMLPEVGYLSDKHRHMFHFTCKKKVNHDNRDVEFIMFRKDIMTYLTKYYSEEFSCLDFSAMSCEMLAEELLDRFGLEYCSVFEDGENGGEVYYE